METITLAGAVIIKDQAILVLHRAPKNWYELPGGKVEPGEKYEDTVVRELLEEISVKVNVGKELGMKDFEQDNKHFSYHWFAASMPVNAEIDIPEKETFMHDHFRWLPLADLANFPKSPNLENFYQAYTKRTIGL